MNVVDIKEFNKKINQLIMISFLTYKITSLKQNLMVNDQEKGNKNYIS